MKTRPALVLALVAITLGAVAAAIHAPSTASSMTSAAKALVQSLNDQQKKTALKPFDDPSRLGWHFIPKNDRKGLQLRDMTDPQRALAQKLLQAALSQVGYTKARTIMSLESLLRELEKSKKGGNIRDELRYYWTIFGDPTSGAKWGLSVEGHHFSQNFVVDGDKVQAFTPCFFGSNPAVAHVEFPGVARKGDRVQAAEEDLAFELLGKLDDAQRRLAVIDAKAPKEIRAAGEPHAPADPPAGLPASKMTADQAALFRKLISAYLDNLPSEIAQSAMKQVEADFPQAHFAWAGADKKGIGHYYRLQGPSFVAEFINNQADAMGTPANHIHAVWRDLRGDFGVPR